MNHVSCLIDLAYGLASKHEILFLYFSTDPNKRVELYECGHVFRLDERKEYLNFPIKDLLQCSSNADEHRIK